MHRTPMAMLWARTALVWFLATMAFGMYLGITGRFGQTSAHAHLGLLGWLSPLGFALLYSFAAIETAGLSHRLQWAMFNIGLVVQVTAMWMVLQQGAPWGMVIGIGGAIVIVSIAWLIALLWPRLRTG